jgi:hypothetical protein
MKFLKYLCFAISSSFASPITECDGILNLAWGSVSNTKPREKYCNVMLDGFDTSKNTINWYKSKNINTIAYTSVGTRERWRPDYEKFNDRAFVSKWLNPRNWKLVKPVIQNRFKLFKEKGFDGVEIDNIDLIGNVKEANMNNVYEYGMWLSNLAHDMDLKIFLKNTPYLCEKFVDNFDGLITEQADEYPLDINGYKYFIDNDKPWWDFEYKFARNKRLLKLATRVYRSTEYGWLKQK